MGRYLALLLALIVGSWIAFVGEKLPDSLTASTPLTEFAGERAFNDVNFMAAVPHPVGTVANQNVRDAIMGRMLRLGLNPQVRPGVGVQQPRGASDIVAAGVVENLVGVLPGRDRSLPAVALMAHYDSVPGSPGAADDLMGVASALEVVRAIKARGTPVRDVMLVITDGEEAGLLGANHFFRRDPLALHIGLVFNMEARGSGGRVNMFQTSPQNGGLIDLFQKTARRPASSSLSVLIYEKLPNDTDLTETLRAKVAGLNYAIIGNQFDYHSPTSTAATLERGSLQDMGDQVLAAAGYAAFERQLPAKAPNAIYANVLGDTVVAYPAWGGWALLAVIAVLLLFAIRWARHSGEFPASDILRGMGAQLFAGLGTVAVLEFARRLTGAEFGYLEQRFLLAQVTRWEWAIMLISLGFLMFAAGDMARGRRWMAAFPLVLGLACSAFGEFDVIGAVTGVLAGAIGVFIYNRPASRKGAWAGVLLVTWILGVIVQAVAPGASYVVAWPLLLGAIGAAATSLSAKRGLLSFVLLVVLASAALGWEGGLSHFAFEAMDLMPLFAIQMITAGVVLWPLAQPDTNAEKGLVVGSVLLIAGFVITFVIRAEDPWTPRHPQVSYVGYHLDQDTGKAWRFSLAKARPQWSDMVMKADGGVVQPYAHWAWRRELMGAPARPLPAVQPVTSLGKTADGGLMLHVAGQPEARELDLQLRATVPGRVLSLGGVPMDMALIPGKWVRVYWFTAGKDLDVAIQPSGPGRLDVRYMTSRDAWPQGAIPLPTRPSDVMPWDSSDSTFVTGTRAFTW